MLTRLHKYGYEVNSHDAIKALAVIIMTIDHIGWFIYPDELWWRAIGRITFPVWFFLAGYAMQPSPRLEIFWWALALEVIGYATHLAFFPLNALFTILLCQLALRAMQQRQWLETQPLAVWVMCVLFAFPTMIFMEYGAAGLMFACLGYMVKHKLRGRIYTFFAVLTFTSFSALQLLIFDFNLMQAGVMLVLMGVVTLYLWQFRVVSVPWLNQSRAVNLSGRILSRYSLEYYVLHRAILQAIAAFIVMSASMQGFVWFN